MPESEINYEQLFPTRNSVVTSNGVEISPTKVLQSMKVGDSFIVDTKRGRSSLISAAWRLDIKISVRKEGQKFRVFRIP